MDTLTTRRILPHLLTGLLASTLLAPAAFAQSAPFAPGPQHPMTAPLPKEHPDAALPDELLDARPIATPPLSFRAVTDNRLTEHDPITATTRTLPIDAFGSSATRGRPGSDAIGEPAIGEPAIGSIPSIESEPFDPGSIIGADNRIRIANAASYPWRANAKLYMTFPNGASYVGSCTIVNARYALTAGHCIYSHADGGWARSVRVVPGQSGSYAPYGSAWVRYMRTYTGWTRNADYQHDIALITLDRNIGSTTGWLGFGNWSNLNGVTANMGAYDPDWWRDHQKYRVGSTLPQSLVIFHFMDTNGGASGGGVYRFVNGNRYVMSVHTTGFGWINGSTRITSSRFNYFVNSIQSGF